MSGLEEYASREEQARALARLVARQLSQTIEAKGNATLAVAGGTTPGPFFEALSRERLDWSSVRVLPTDERIVPETSERSNARLIRETLVQNEAAKAVFVSLSPSADAVTPEDAAADATGRVLPVLPLDIAVLGMGADMHTASLFPGGDRLADALAPGAPAILPMRAPGAAEARLTLSAPVLATATHLHLLLTGREKREALASAQAAPDAVAAPIRAILDAPAGATIHWAA
ncbi:MAG: 6-phosphogluconolactonase [Rubricella sp.]